MKVRKVPPRGGIFLFGGNHTVVPGIRRDDVSTPSGVKVNKSFRLRVALYRSYLGPWPRPMGSAAQGRKLHVDRPVGSHTQSDELANQHV